MLSKTRAFAFRFAHRGVSAIPHPKKKHRGGEDAFLTHDRAIGVADGVGGCADQGIDPAIFTRNVMGFTLDAIRSSSRPLTALEALEKGCVKAFEGPPGACPVTLATLVEERFASILNLGDCGTVMLRQGKPLYISKPQQVYFNCPFQLPSHKPSDGDQVKIEVKEGDVFLCASDGVFDNLETSEIIKLLSETGATDCLRVARSISSRASLNAVDDGCFSPFSQQLWEMGYREPDGSVITGGKLDDITVVVARVSKDHTQSHSPALITDILDDIVKA